MSLCIIAVNVLVLFLTVRMYVLGRSVKNRTQAVISESSGVLLVVRGKLVDHAGMSAAVEYLQCTYFSLLSLTATCAVCSCGHGMYR